MNDMSADVKTLWQSACRLIAQESEFAYASFFKNIVPLAYGNGELKLGISDQFSADWIVDNYTDLLQDAVRGAFGTDLKVSFEYGYVPESGSSEENVPLAETTPAPESLPVGDEPVKASLRTAEHCLEENTFENFVEGEENRYALMAAMTTAQKPGTFNPLYIYGGSGMGKTHLIQAVANYAASNRPDSVVRYTTCEEFLNEYVASLRSKTDFKFRDRFRNVDLLLVDDVHFLSGKDRLQEEFFNTFNALHNAGKQIILTSDKQPSEIPGLEKRLVSRFQSGMTMQITSSTYETRLAILRQAQESMSTKFDDSVLSFLASHITSNIRPLKSALIRLSVYAAAGVEITAQKTEELLADLLNKEAEEKTSRLSVEAIQKAVAEFFELQVRDLTGKARPQNIADARMVAMYLCRKLTNYSQQDIGAAFGGRSHATVIHAIKKVEDSCLADESMKRTVSTLQRRLQYQ